MKKLNEQKLPQRGCINQPRVEAWPLPWAIINHIINPNGVASDTHDMHHDATPLGLGFMRVPHSPRVASLSQPWAVRQNPVGIPACQPPLAEELLVEFWKLEKEVEKMLEELAR